MECVDATDSELVTGIDEISLVEARSPESGLLW